MSYEFDYSKGFADRVTRDLFETKINDFDYWILIYPDGRLSFVHYGLKDRRKGIPHIGHIVKYTSIGDAVVVEMLESERILWIEEK